MEPNINQLSEFVSYLSNNISDNINLINFIENYPIHYMKQAGDTFLVKGTSDKDWIYICSNSVSELQTLSAELNADDTCFAAVKDWMLPVLAKGRELKWCLSSLKLMLPNDIIVQQPKHPLSELTIEDAEFIYSNSDYRDFISVSYILDRLSKGVSSCVCFEGKPIAWGMTQDDGAIGFLHVLPEFRRKGLGQDVTLDLIHKVRKQNKVPFLHIEEKNIKSMSLATGIGFRKIETIHWVEFS